MFPGSTNLKANSALYAEYMSSASAYSALRVTQISEDNYGMGIGENIRRRRKANKWTLDDLASKIGTDTGNLSRLERGEQGFSEKLLTELAKAFNIEIFELFLEEDVIKFKKMRNVPVVGNTQAGPPDRIWEENGYPTGYGDEYIPVTTEDGNAYGLRVVGDSMYPFAREGDYVLVEPMYRPEPGDEVIVKTTDGRVMLKVFAQQKNDTLLLDSFNDTFKRISLNIAEIEFMHSVSAVYRLKTIKRRIITVSEGDIPGRRKTARVLPKPTTGGQAGVAKPDDLTDHKELGK